ncbi:hypothetical protein Axy10_023 [Achromobacter phage vB_AxyP_19-32_Axy10]|uniref:Uncharacterized protein n=1 Tax=Achromobacter phage vB_AxyP_19-32_Axy10 TaxID=2591041 RepID=A0A514CU00_9CAUD|nr:hypothetical protein KMC59_gp23 [Achromobacter phage vB_AxyP_19-32_Axy10]QDH83953.1 hypothetical protein Axy10_023 [Achromobacter phage vB_AxyP_19-32_Axy10]
MKKWRVFPLRIGGKWAICTDNGEGYIFLKDGDKYVRFVSKSAAQARVDEENSYMALEQKHLGDADKKTGIYSPVASKDQILEFLQNACRAYGAYEVTKMLCEVTKASSEEFLAHGNTGAIIHADAKILHTAVLHMAISHPLRAMDLKGLT